MACRHIVEAVCGNGTHGKTVHKHVAHMESRVGCDGVGFAAIVSNCGCTHIGNCAASARHGRNHELGWGECGGNGMVRRQRGEDIRRNCANRLVVNGHVQNGVTFVRRDEECRGGTQCEIAGSRRDGTVLACVHRHIEQHLGKRGADAVILSYLGERVGNGGQTVSLGVGSGLPINGQGSDIVAIVGGNHIHGILIVEIRGSAGRGNGAVGTCIGRHCKHILSELHLIQVIRGDVCQQFHISHGRIFNHQVNVVALDAVNAVADVRRGHESIHIVGIILKLHAGGNYAVAQFAGRNCIVVLGERHINRMKTIQMFERIGFNVVMFHTVNNDT